jgi:hypothetical protein
MSKKLVSRKPTLPLFTALDSLNAQIMKLRFQANTPGTFRKENLNGGLVLPAWIWESGACTYECTGSDGGIRCTRVSCIA